MSVEAAAVVAKWMGCSVETLTIYARKHGLPFKWGHCGAVGRPRRVYVREEVEAWIAAGNRPSIGRKKGNKDVKPRRKALRRRHRDHDPQVEARAREAMARRRARKAEEEGGEREGIRGGRQGAPSAFGTSPGGGGGPEEGGTVCRRCGEEKVASPRWWCDSCLEVAGRLQKRGMTMVQIAASGELDAEPDGGEHGLGWRGIRSDVVIGERYWQPRDD